MPVNDTSMKKIWATRLADVNSTDKEGIGALRFEGAKIFKYVQYSDGAANLVGASGDAVGYVTYTATSVLVTTDNSDTFGIGAGMLLATVTDLQFCWIQVKGRAVLSTTIGGTPANGSPLTFTGAADRATTRLNEQAAAAGALVKVGWAIDQATRIVVLDCSF